MPAGLAAIYCLTGKSSLFIFTFFSEFSIIHVLNALLIDSTNIFERADVYDCSILLGSSPNPIQLLIFIVKIGGSEHLDITLGILFCNWFNIL